MLVLSFSVSDQMDPNWPNAVKLGYTEQIDKVHGLFVRYNLG